MIDRIIRLGSSILYKTIGPKHAFELAMSPLGKSIFALLVGNNTQIMQIKTKYDFLIRLTRYQYFMSGYFFLGETNPLETQLVRKILQPGDVFFDIGAHIGWYSLVASQRIGSEGHVYAFEPNPGIADESQSNYTLNSMRNVHLYRTALSDMDGYDSFWVGDDMGGSLIKENTEKLTLDGEVKKIRVKTEKLSTFCKKENITHITLMKIDVEGAEMKILSSSREMIKKFEPCFLVELIGQEAKRETINFFAELGYTPYSFIGTGLQKIERSSSQLQTVNVFFCKRKHLNRLQQRVAIN